MTIKKRRYLRMVEWEIVLLKKNGDPISKNASPEQGFIHQWMQDDEGLWGIVERFDGTVTQIRREFIRFIT